MKRITQILASAWTATALVFSLSPTSVLAGDDGDCGLGAIVYERASVDTTTDVWRLEGTYEVTTANCSFTVFASGKVYARSGLIVLNGEVLAGSADFVGAQAHVRAQASPDFLCSAGTITIIPKNAADNSAPLWLDFDKSLAGPGPAPYVATFNGSVSGDLNGCLITRVTRRVQRDDGKVEIEARMRVCVGLNLPFGFGSICFLPCRREVVFRRVPEPSARAIPWRAFSPHCRAVQRTAYHPFTLRPLGPDHTCHKPSGPKVRHVTAWAGASQRAEAQVNRPNKSPEA